MSDTQITLEFLANTDGLKAAAQQIQLLGTITKEQYAQFIKLGAENEKMLKQQAAAQQQLTGAVKQTADAGKDMSDSFRNMGQAIVQTNLQQALANVTAEVTKTTKEADKLSKTKPLVALKDSAEAVSAALNLAKDSMALYGKESKDLEKAIKKVEAVTKVLSDAQTVSAKLFGEQNVFAKLAAAGQWMYATAVGASTGAMKVLRVVMASLGLGAVMLAIGTLVENWDRLKKAVTDNAAKINAFIGKIQEAIPVLGYVIKPVQFLIQNFDKMSEVIAGVGEVASLVFTKLGDSIAALADLDFAAVKKTWANFGEQVQQAFNEGRRKQSEQNAFDKQLAEAALQVQLAETLGKGVYEAKKKYLELEIQDLNKRNEDTRLKEAELTKLIADETTRRKEAADKAKAEYIRIEKEKYDAVNARNKQFIADDIAATEAKLLTVEANTQAELDLYKELIDAKKMMVEVDPGLSVEKRRLELTKLDKEYEGHYNRILLNQANAEINRQNANQKALDELQQNHDLQLKLQQDFGLTQQQIDDEFAASSFATFKEYEEKKREECELTLQKAKETQKEIDAYVKQVQSFLFDTASQLINSSFENDKEMRDQQLNNTLQSLDKQKQAELSNKDLTEQQKKDIEEKYRRMEADAKRKAWKADQQAKAEQALINGVLAFTMSLAQQGYPAGLITGALALASAGVQAGIILSKPMPQFARGGKNIPAGMKLVGEQGPELIWTPGGETVIPHGDTAKILEAWSIPVPNVNPAIKTDVALAAALPAGIDYNKLAVVLAQELRNNPSVNINMDSNGFALHLLDKNKRVQLLNNRYSA